MTDQLFLDYERISHHRSMLSDSLRTERFREALRKTVKEGGVVADLGSGTGILSFFAEKYGAGKVYAIERTDIGVVAETVARDNGFGRIIFLRRDSSSVQLEEKCDVLVSECIGYFALQENMISDVLEFRKRNLKPSGVVIPSKIDMFVVPISSQTAFSEIEFWSTLHDVYGVDYSALRRLAANSAYAHAYDGIELLSTPNKLHTIDLLCDDSVNLDSTASFIVEKDSVLHGFCGYFTALLAPDVTIDTAPGVKTHWGRQFFPCNEPITLKKGAVVEFRIKAILNKGFVDWVWQIRTDSGDWETHDTRIGIRLKEQ